MFINDRKHFYTALIAHAGVMPVQASKSLITNSLIHLHSLVKIDKMINEHLTTANDLYYQGTRHKFIHYTLKFLINTKNAEILQYTIHVF